MSLPVSKQTPPQIKAKFFASLIRPQISVLPLAIYVSILLVHKNLSVENFILGWLLLLASYAVVVIHNDITDIQIDKANRRRDTPLATGLLNKKDALYALTVSLAVGFASAILLEPWALVWFVVYIVLGWLYSGYFAFKNKGYFALIVLAICYGVMPWILGIIASNTMPDAEILVIIFASFLFVFGIISLKDFKDRKGDEKYGKKTILVVKGSRFTKNIILSFTSIAYVVLIALTALQGSWQLTALSTLFLLVNTALISNPKLTLMATTRSRNGKLARLMFFINAIIIYAGI